MGTEYEVEVGVVAHGGICVARHEGRVIFVRHALPGERVRARVTEGMPGDRFLRADAIEVLTPSPDRVEPPCRYAGPGRCGGCDWQHATLAAQRKLKAAVLAEQLRRLAHLDLDPVVEAVPGAEDGSGWRTRVRFAVDRAGRLGLRKSRSHEVVTITECFIAHPAVNGSGVLEAIWSETAEVAVTAAGSGERAVLIRPSGPPAHGRAARPRMDPLLDTDVELMPDVPAGVSATERVVERVGGRVYAVPAGGFWQVHPAAASTLTEAVAEALVPRPGEALLDLYAGSGLFAGVLAATVAPGGTVVAVEGDAAAVAAARDNLDGMPGVTVIADRVDHALAVGVGPADLVVLDPPRTGAGRVVVEAIAALRPRRVVYVACDPAALARDIAIFAETGYALSGLRAFDLFPHTHHLEAVATLEPAVPSGT
ncbi:class I SAM-dependent RNA methyltransferase [Sporichthya sp.]|uniref:class I SAM-dependent RNA methyltransferase n=1 Tax=Sporichthya sp. TaxID=65475 RepID=UPI0025FE68F5|nr:TRAM domain-containing protein [Sporichthya sp.]